MIKAADGTVCGPVCDVMQINTLYNSKTKQNAKKQSNKTRTHLL